jgi:glycosyltransferase involved in cell wall biosynthesis
MPPPELSVVVLCYRSRDEARGYAANIAATLAEAGINDYQLVLVANYKRGTEDSTPQVVRELAARDPRIVCSTLPKDGMMGWDMRTGLVLATGRTIAVIDGDGQVLVEDLVRVHRKLTTEGYDLVQAYRLRRGDGVVRKSLSLTFNTLFRVLFPGIHVRDVNAKPKILTRRAYDRMTLVSDDWFIDAEIMIEARRLGLRIGEVPTEFLGLTGRRSFVNLRAVLEFVGNLARFRWREFRR